MEDLFYVYSHSDSNGVVRYIGKGKKYGKRYIRAHYFLHRHTRWYEVFPDKKLIDVKIIEDNLTKIQAYEAEHKWILHYGFESSGGTLVNKIDSLFFLSPKERNKIYRTTFLNKYPEKAKISQRKWKDKNKVKNEEHQKKYRESHRELILERARLFRQRNRERLKEYKKEWIRKREENKNDNGS
jgi:hypothetical protein